MNTEDTAPMKKKNSYRFGEGETGVGQLVQFTHPCEPEGLGEKIRTFLRENVRTVSIPTTGMVNVSHGGYGRYTRYFVNQLKYAGGGPGYIEVLEIKNPPDGRHGIVLYEYRAGISDFVEYKTAEDACAAFEKLWSVRSDRNYSKDKGYMRQVKCFELTPWFYAVGDELLIGDFAFPEGLQDDPVFRIGQKFLVYEYGNVPCIKTCLGTRLRKYKLDYHPYTESEHRLIHWDDGTVLDERTSRDNKPIPIRDDQAWIAEAIQQFRSMLTGKETKFVINFANGHKFVGQMVTTGKPIGTAEGSYFVLCKIKGEKKAREGKVDFKPTDELPDVEKYVRSKLKDDLEIEKFEIKTFTRTKNGKKWSGVFF
jgi:hypothetical protein